MARPAEPVAAAARPIAAVLAAGTRIWRVHPRGRSPLCGQPLEMETVSGAHSDVATDWCRVRCFAATPAVAILETLVRGRAAALIPRAALDGREVSELLVVRGLAILCLDGRGLPDLETGAHESGGRDSEALGALSVPWRVERPEFDGVRFRSGWDEGTLCWAIADRAIDALRAAGPPRRLGDPHFATSVLRQYPHVGVT